MVFFGQNADCRVSASIFYRAMSPIGLEMTHTIGKV